MLQGKRAHTRFPAFMHPSENGSAERDNIAPLFFIAPEFFINPQRKAHRLFFSGAQRTGIAGIKP